MRLYLLLSRPDLQDYARRVCECLTERFGVSDVAVGSAYTPLDALWHRASTTNHNNSTSSSRITTPAVLFVQLGPSTPTTCTLESEGVAPLLVLSIPPAAASKGGEPSDKKNAEEEEEAVRDAALWLAKYCALTSLEVRLCVERAVASTRQARLVADAQLRTWSYRYAKAIADCHDQGRAITGDGVTFVEGRVRGKVRDRYEPTAAASDATAATNRRLALVTTDRQSGFDRMLAVVPFKGAVLNLTSSFWFQQTQHIVPNHLLSAPHPCVSIVRKCTPFPIEFVVRYVVCESPPGSSHETTRATRGNPPTFLILTLAHVPRAYMTGSTSTSIWKNYQDGVRNYCGHALPEGMVKNQKLAQTLLTPTTKEEDHDRPISLQVIVQDGFMSQADLDVCATAALQVFALGQSVALERGLILVDTKYEFGKDDEDGTIRLIDEVHTPDSSRYWLASTYERRIAAGKEPDNIDKEFLRLWFRDHCDPYHDAVLPDAPRDLVLELSRRYVTLYEMITGDNFDFDIPDESAIADAIRSNLL